ncbi:MAG: helix-turn-helix domain-containing protein [Desulfobacterales bacterium]|nr:helix-turn-helix domain-containing protein [Desulfobacterales bacterium]
MEKICIVKRRRGGLGAMALPRIEALEQTCPQEVTIELTSQQSEAIRSNSHFQQLYGRNAAPIFLNVHLDAVLPFRMLKTENVCDILQVSRHTVMRLVKAETIRSHKIGRLRRFCPEDVMEYLSHSLETSKFRSLHTYVLASERQ